MLLHSTPLHSTPLHSTPLPSTPLHSTALHSTPLQRGRSWNAVVRAEADVHSHPDLGPGIEDAGNAGPWTLALQALRAYEQQRGPIEDLHYPGGNEARVQMCDDHRFLLHNLPNADAVPQYEGDQNNNLRLQEHWRHALRDLRN